VRSKLGLVVALAVVATAACRKPADEPAAEAVATVAVLAAATELPAGATPAVPGLDKLKDQAMQPGDAPAAGGQLPPGHPPVPGLGHPGTGADPAAAHAGLAPPQDVTIGTVAPADLAIANLRAQKQQKANTVLSVRGRVWKVSRGILERNWLHIKDKDGGEDLVVTSTQDAQVGQVVVARGKVGVDKDVGAGYQYDVLIEDAALTVEP
jgi:hypothetical protein